MRVLLAHPGTQYSAQLARQLERHGVLNDFYTGMAFSGDGAVASAVEKLPAPWRKKVANRRVAGVPSNHLRTRLGQELTALVALRCGMDEQQVFYRRNAAFQRSIPTAAIRRSSAVIGFDTSSWILVRRARDEGRAFLLDRSIAHPRSFVDVAARLNREFPAWSSQVLQKDEADFAREAQEHAEASVVVVPSRFVARTLADNGVEMGKVRINPFGVDLARFEPPSMPPPPQPLRFVFAGALVPRKGFPLLLDAWSKLPPNHGAELWVAGGGEIPPAVRSSVPDSVRILGRLPHAELARLFAQCHVFVFASYFEGLAQVQLEAAACGLPVIGTDSAGSGEIVREGETGFIVPGGDMDALRAALMRFISSPELALAMRKRLLAERARWSWDAYGDRWMTILKETLKC